MAAETGQIFAQEEQDLLSLLGREETTEYAAASFKTNRVINLHSLESTAAGVLDVKISHRFGYLSDGLYGLFGLDLATIRLGADYGITDKLTIGAGRSSYEKSYDGFIKYKLYRQSTGLREMPVTIAILGTACIETIKWEHPERENLASSRYYYAGQLIIGRKFSDGFSFQVSPTLVHRNLVETNEEHNDVFALGFAGRMKLNKRLSLNAEYIYLFPNQVAEGIYNSFSIGFDIETGGHVFQLHFTNSASMVERGFVAESNGNWADGDIHFGFNISRVFTIVKPKA